MSSMVIIQPIIWGLMYLDLYFTGTTSGLGNWLGSLLLDLGVMKPSSRQQESEADYVGLLLMSQSCYDPKEAVGLWERMEQAQKGGPPEWLSTHPSVSRSLSKLRLKNGA
jgi:metalloendopeptidase OMA1, mitochondrial